MMNLGSYFQSELKEIYEQEGLVDDHYSLLFQSQNASQKYTKKQISDKLSEYKTLISQIDAQEDPMATWEEYLDFLMNYQDRTISEINQQIFQELEKFTKYCCERDYIKRDHRCVRFWIEYSDMCKDKEDVIYHMEENEIGANSAFFYEEICKITEMKMDYQQADRYILEGKYSQAQPEAKMNEIVTQFEQRMEQRINRLKQLTSMQIMYDNQLSDSKKRKRFEFDLRIDHFFEQQQPIIRKTLGKNNFIAKEEHDHKGIKFGNKRFSNSSYFGVSKMKQKKKQLPDKVYIGDGINIFVDEEYRQEVFPNSTILVTEYQNLVEEINEYLANNHDYIIQSQSQKQQQQINQMQFLSQQLMNSAQLSQKNKQELIISLQVDMFFPKKSVFEIDLQTSWIGREEKKYKSFEVMESQKNSQQIVQFNICDFIFENTSPCEQSPQLGFIMKNMNPQKQNQANLNGRTRELNQDNFSSITPQRSPQKNKPGIIECESVFGSQSPYKFSSKQYGFYQSTQNNLKNKRQQIKNVNSYYDPSPLQNSSKRISLNYSNYQINEESQNNQKADECSQNAQFSSYNFNQNQQISVEKSPLKSINEDFKQKVSKFSSRKSIDFNQNNQNTEQTQQISPQSSEKFSNKEENLNKFYIESSVKKLNFCNENSKQIENKQNVFDFSKSSSYNLPNKQQNSYYHSEDDSNQSFENSCLNKAFHNDINNVKSDDDEDEDGVENGNDDNCNNSSSLDLYSDQYSFLKNKNLSKSSKLSECVRSRKSSKFEKIDIFIKNDLSSSPSQEKLRMSSKRASINKKSVEKLRNTHQPIATILNNQNLNNQSFQSIQFSQEFSQVHYPQYTQEAFFSPNSLDDNIFKIIPPPKRKSTMNSKANKTKKIKNYKDDEAQNLSESDSINSKKSLTEQEDEEINDMLDQYCFSNENKFINQNIQNSLSNFTDSLQEKENQNLIINQRRSKSQNSMPRKALQQLPIEEFTEEAIFLENPILPLFLSNNNLHDDAFYTSQISNQENENQLFYSHNQFRNSRNGRSHQNHNSNHEHKSNLDEINFQLNEESQFNQNLDHILSKSICQNNYKNEFQNQIHSHHEHSNQSLNSMISKTKQHQNDNIHMNEGFKEDQFFNHIIEEACFKNEKKLKTIKRMN
ncbi:hypothetical protein ABPG72_006375 [Tetrahymena utriculariae]